MGPVELEVGPEYPVRQKAGGKTESRLNPKETLLMGEEEGNLFVEPRGEWQCHLLKRYRKWLPLRRLPHSCVYYTSRYD